MVRHNFYNELKNVFNQSMLYLFLFILASLSFMWMIFAKIEIEYTLVRLSPLVYIIILLIFIRPQKLIGISSMALYVLYFIKLCVDPVVCVLGDFYTIVSDYIVLKNWNKACALLWMEWLIVAIVLRWRSPHYMNKYVNAREQIDSIKNEHSLIKMCGYILLGGAIFIYVIYPSIHNQIFFVWQKDTSYLVAKAGGLFYIFKIFWELGKPLVIFWLFYFVSTKIRGRLKFIFQIFLIIITFIVMSDYRILSLLEAAVLIFILMLERYRKYNSRSGLLKLLFVVAILYVVIVLTTHNEVGNRNLANLCRLLDIYTGGYMTATAGLEVSFDNGLVMFLHDIFNGSYILKGMFGSFYSTTDAINASINVAAKGIFFESMVQARALFGILCPLAIGGVTDFVICMDYHYNLEKDLLYRAIFIMCGFSTAVFMLMYTYTMIVNFIIWKACVWLLILWCDKHIKLIHKKDVWT